MGIELTLLPIDSDSGSWGYSHTILPVGLDEKLLDAIDNLESFTRPTFKLNAYVSRVPDGKMQGECCYGHVDETPYGQKIRYVHGSELAVVLGKGECATAKAAALYLDTTNHALVALYWR
jgi:hypothetical protein